MPLTALKSKLYVGSPVYWGIIAIIAFFLLVPVPNTEWIFQLGKLTFLGIIILFTAAYIFLNREKYILAYPKIIFLVTLVYLAWITLTNTVFSSHPEYTVIGWQNWNGGLLANIIYWAIFLLVGFQRKDKVEEFSSSVKDFINLSIIFGVFTAVLTVLETLGFDILLSSSLAKSLGIELIKTTYPILTVGNPGWLSGIFSIILPLTSIYIYRNQYNKFILVSIVFLLGISATQSNINAIIFSIFMFCVAISLFNRKNFFIGVVIVMLGFLPNFTTQGLISINSQLRVLGLVNRDFKNNEFDMSGTSSSAKGRAVIYLSTLRNISERPLTGWGYETLLFNFYEKLTTAEENFLLREVMAATPEETVTRDEMTIIATKEKNGLREHRVQIFFMVKPHNYLLEEIYSNGIAGLFFLSFILVQSFLSFFKRYNDVKIILFTSTISYLVYLMIWFLNPSVSVLGFVILGLFLSYDKASSSSVENFKSYLNRG